MDEDPQSSLLEYNAQLEQVNAALDADPENDDLTKLKKDLEDVIELTKEVIYSSVAATVVAAAATSSAEAPAATVRQVGDDSSSKKKTDVDEALASTLSYLASKWRVGDTCMAPWSHNTRHYEALIDEILGDGTCTVTFMGYDQSDVVKLTSLRTMEEHKREEAVRQEQVNARKRKKDQFTAQQEYKKKKALKKQMRQKQLEEEREKDKKKWSEFNTKLYSKTNKGKPMVSRTVVKPKVDRVRSRATGGPGSKSLAARFNLPEKYRKATQQS